MAGVLCSLASGAVSGVWCSLASGVWCSQKANSIVLQCTPDSKTGPILKATSWNCWPHGSFLTVGRPMSGKTTMAKLFLCLPPFHHPKHINMQMQLYRHAHRHRHTLSHTRTHPPTHAPTHTHDLHDGCTLCKSHTKHLASECQVRHV